MAFTLLRVRRMARNVSMKEAATEVDLNISAFGKIERGDAKPSKRVAALLSQRYNMPIEELLRPLRP